MTKKQIGMIGLLFSPVLFALLWFVFSMTSAPAQTTRAMLRSTGNALVWMAEATGQGLTGSQGIWLEENLCADETHNGALGSYECSWDRRVWEEEVNSCNEVTLIENPKGKYFVTYKVLPGFFEAEKTNSPSPDAGKVWRCPNAEAQNARFGETTGQVGSLMFSAGCPVVYEKSTETISTIRQGTCFTVTTEMIR